MRQSLTPQPPLPPPSQVASASHKPGGQAVVPRRAAAALLATIPLSKLPGFGGKLGDALAGAGMATPAAVAAASLADVAAALGGDADRAVRARAAAAGESDAPVAEKAASKSIMAAKSLDTPAPTAAALERWLHILAGELADRLAADGRPPRSLALSYRRRGGGSAERSVSGPAPRGGGGGAPDAGALARAARALLARAGGAALPCTRVTLTASDFAAPPATGAASIARFLSKAAGEPAVEAPAAPEPEEPEPPATATAGPAPEPAPGPEPATAPAPAAAPGPPSSSPLLDAVDLAEQRSIMRDIELSDMRARTGGGGGKRAAAPAGPGARATRGRGGGGRQTSLPFGPKQQGRSGGV